MPFSVQGGDFRKERVTISEHRVAARIVRAFVFLARLRVAHIARKAASRDDEIVPLSPQAVELLAARRTAKLFLKLANAIRRLPLVIVGQSFEEQQREDVSLVVLHLPAQTGVGHSPEEVSQLLF